MEKYRRGEKEWARKLRPLRWICYPAAFFLLAVGTYFHLGAAFLGLAAGCAVGLYVAFRETPPEHVDRWARGAEGERRTAKELERLSEAGYVVRHDLLTDWGNWDHVVVGPNGVFLLDTKSLSGSVGVGPDGVFVMRSEDPEENYVRDLGRYAVRQACDLNARIEQHVGCKVWVHAVVVFWGRFDERVFEEKNVAYVHGEEIASWIQRHRSGLSPEKLRDVITYLNKHSSLVVEPH